MRASLLLGLFVLTTACRPIWLPEIRHARALVNARHEITLDAATSKRAADDVMITALFSTPSGNVVTVGGFASRGQFKVRYTPREPGLHRWTILDLAGNELARGDLEARTSSGRGFVHVDPANGRRLVADDGTTTFILGENRINVYDASWNYDRADIRSYLERMAAYGMSTIRVIVPEPRLAERAAEALDTLFDAAEAANVDVILVAFANPPKGFFRDPDARRSAVRKLRYLSDRWGASPRLLAIDLLDEPERNGAIEERVWIPWAEELSRAWRAFDPYGHLITAGPVGLHWNVSGDEEPWYESRANDLVQWHLFGREVQEPHALADAMARKVEETAWLDKSVFCGSFAHGREEGPAYDHTHVGIWSLAMSGAGALANSAPAFALDFHEPMAPERAAHFEVLSTFLRSLDPRRAHLPVRDVRILAPTEARVWSLATNDESDRALWILGPKDGYGDRVLGASLAISVPRGGRYRVRWLDDTTGKQLSAMDEIAVATDDDLLVLQVPPFTRHAAARLTHE